MNVIASLFISFFKIGLFSFGGGYAMLPLVFETAKEFGIYDEAFTQLIALTQSIPGAVAVNSATYVGFYAGGFLGALSTTIALALPSFILVYLVTHFLSKFKESELMETVFEGIRPMTIGLIATAFVYMSQTSIFNEWVLGIEAINVVPFIIFVCTSVLSGKFKLNPIVIILLSALIGAFAIR